MTSPDAPRPLTDPYEAVLSLVDDIGAYDDGWRDPETADFSVELVLPRSLVWNLQDHAARSASPDLALAAALARIRDHGYQPMYNGRPSCPFCSNFVDDEETHRADCPLLAALRSDQEPA